jgi:protoporphyrinogen oxidase
VGGALAGAANPDRQLDRLERDAQRRGGVVATVEVEGHEIEESVKSVFARHGAKQVDRHAF